MGVLGRKVKWGDRKEGRRLPGGVEGNKKVTGDLRERKKWGTLFRLANLSGLWHSRV